MAVQPRADFHQRVRPVRSNKLLHVKDTLPYDHCAWSDDRAPHDGYARRDDGAARPSATGAINAAGANNGVRLFDRGHHASHHNEGSDGGYDRLFHINSP
jgi:hypothetical protein